MWLDKLELRLGRYAVPHITLVLVIGQVLFFLVGAGAPTTGLVNLMTLDAQRVVAQGEVWRLVTFLFIPPTIHPIFLIFAWYLFYLMGTTLERQWGTLRFNLFILIGWLATAAIAFLPPGLPVTNEYLAGSVFLAFAYLFPEFQILLFFILPVRIKWLALITWLGYAWSLLFASDWTERFAILAATTNFLLFFGRDILGRLRSANRLMVQQTVALKDQRLPRHTCRVCGVTNLSEPDLEFRYCTDCKPAQCYCPKHLDRHAHTKSYP